MIKDKEELTAMVLDGLQGLIMMGFSATVQRSYSPTADPDDDSDVIKAGDHQVERLRSLRTDFENLLLGGIHD